MGRDAAAQPTCLHRPQSRRGGDETGFRTAPPGPRCGHTADPIRADCWRWRCTPREPRFATSGQDGRILVWSATDGRVEHAIDLDGEWVEHIAWSPDGRMLAAAAARVVHVFEPGGGVMWRTDKQVSTVSALAWPSSEELATACYGRINFFEASSGAPRQTLAWKGSLVSMVLSPDGGIVACGSQDNTVHFWRRATGEDSMMAGYPGKPSALAFDDSGTLLATSGGPMVTVWSFQGDGPEDTEPGVLELHDGPITTLAFARRGLRLASGGRDGAVVVWALNRSGSGQAVGAARLEAVVAKVLWRPDARGLVALDGQGGVTAWRVQS